MSDVFHKLRLLIPRLASPADGEVLATVATIRRVLADSGRDLHDLAARLSSGPPRTASSHPSPSDLAVECLRSGEWWKQREQLFLAKMVGRPSWSALSPKQVAYLTHLHDRTAAEAAA